jgi:hypothetical protein
MFCLLTFCLYGCLVPPDVLSLRTFCPYGRFVSTDVLSLRTFCPTDVMSSGVLSPDVLSPDVLSLRTFCLRTFCLGTVHFPEQECFKYDQTLLILEAKENFQSNFLLFIVVIKYIAIFFIAIFL